MPYKNTGGRYDQQQFEMRGAYANEWASGDLITAPCHKPLELYTPCWCLVAAACAPCFSYQMRYRALYSRMENYTCCAGYAPARASPRESSGAPEDLFRVAEVGLAATTLCARARVHIHATQTTARPLNDAGLAPSWRNQMTLVPPQVQPPQASQCALQVGRSAGRCSPCATWHGVLAPLPH
jgi:hypothetical protein